MIPVVLDPDLLSLDPDQPRSDSEGTQQRIDSLFLHLQEMGDNSTWLITDEIFNHIFENFPYGLGKKIPQFRDMQALLFQKLNRHTRSLNEAIANHSIITTPEDVLNKAYAQDATVLEFMEGLLTRVIRDSEPRHRFVYFCTWADSGIVAHGQHPMTVTLANGGIPLPDNDLTLNLFMDGIAWSEVREPDLPAHVPEDQRQHPSSDLGLLDNVHLNHVKPTGIDVFLRSVFEATGYIRRFGCFYTNPDLPQLRRFRLGTAGNENIIQLIHSDGTSTAKFYVYVSPCETASLDAAVKDLNNRFCEQ